MSGFIFSVSLQRSGDERREQRHQQIASNRKLIAAISRETTINEPLKPPRKHPPGKAVISKAKSADAGYPASGASEQQEKGMKGEDTR